METTGIIYLVDKNTKERVAMGTDIKHMYAVKASCEYVRPCFIITVIKGGKAQAA